MRKMASLLLLFLISFSSFGALQGDGVNGHYVVDTHPSVWNFLHNSTAKATISFKYKPQAVQSGTDVAFSTTDISSAGTGTYIAFYTNNTCEYWIYRGATSTKALGISGTNYTLGLRDTWITATYTIDFSLGSNDGKMYRNGVFFAQASQDQAPTDANPNSSPLIGFSPNSVGPMEGTIDDIRVYNRVLSGDEIANIHYMKGHDGITDGLVSRWLLNDSVAGSVAATVTGSVTDITSNGYHGKPSGTTTFRGSSLSYKRRYR